MLIKSLWTCMRNELDSKQSPNVLAPIWICSYDKQNGFSTMKDLPRHWIWTCPASESDLWKSTNQTKRLWSAKVNCAMDFRVKTGVRQFIWCWWWLPVVVQEREDVSFCEVWMSILHLFWQKEVDQNVNISCSLVSTLLKAALNNDSMFLSGILMSTTTEEHKIEVSRSVGWLVFSWWSWNPMSVLDISSAAAVTTAPSWATNHRTGRLSWPIRSQDL